MEVTRPLLIMLFGTQSVFPDLITHPHCDSASSLVHITSFAANFNTDLSMTSDTLEMVVANGAYLLVYLLVINKTQSFCPKDTIQRVISQPLVSDWPK